MLWRQTASLRTVLVTCQTLWLPAGKKAMSPGPSRWILPFSVLVGDEDLAGNNVHRLVDRIVPLEAAGCAGPSHDRQRAVGAFRKPLGARLRISLDDPRGIDRVWRKLDLGGSGESHSGCRHKLGSSDVFRPQAD